MPSMKKAAVISAATSVCRKRGSMEGLKTAAEKLFSTRMMADDRIGTAVGASASRNWRRESRTAESVAPTATMSEAEPVRARRDAVPAEGQHGEEGRFQEEGEDDFDGQRRAEDIPDEARVARPIGAELELHRETGGHADGKSEGEDVDPKARHATVCDSPLAHVARHHPEDQPGQTNS